MPKVLVLPDHIASQIAAGEVVERPASVVKELVENSVDAGATQIEIAVSNDCRDIRIADNGQGMDAEDAVLAFHRHATSKIASADDLWTLRSMGFRGEALPSIASVAKVTGYTRTADAGSGTKVEAAEGAVSATETGCAPGTVIEVADLFYNVPARLKFLKKASTEFAHIHEIVQALAIAYPKITFQLLNRGEVVLKTTGSGKLAQAMQESGFLSGKEELCPVAYAELTHGIAVYGYVARPSHCRGDRKGILAIVNNRPVRCPLTFKALDYAYSDLIPKGKYPLAVLTLTMDPKLVDINVHPTKKEIKYSTGNDVYLAIQRAVVESVRVPRPAEEPAEEGELAPAKPGEEGVKLVSVLADSGSPGPAVDSAAYGVASRPAGAALEGAVAESTAARPARARATAEQQLRFGDRLSYVPPAARPTLLNPAGLAPNRLRATPTLPSGWRISGYLHSTYILVETYEGLEIVEQHIAHERTIYERLLAAQNSPGRLPENAQRLVISAPLNLSPEQRSTLEENSEALRAIGFEFEFGEGAAVLCTQVPLELAYTDYPVTVQKIVDDLASVERAELGLEATKSVACQAAIKNGMPLTEADIIQLLADWEKTPRNDTCPHGRPIRLTFSLEKLFRLFHPG